MIKKIVFILLRVSLGVFFLFSGYTKLFPIEYFEFQLVNDHLSTWFFADIMARMIIAFEMFLGLAFILNIEWKRIIVKAAFVMVTLFTVYLLLTLILRGNEANCNCFGSFVKFSTKESILKNLLLLIAMGFVWYFDKAYSYKFPRIIIISLLLIANAAIFIINPIDKEYNKNLSNYIVNYKIDLDFLYKDPKYKKPPVDLRKGKHVIAFVSLTCPHCKIAALKFSVLKKQYPDLPVYFVMNGDSVDLKPFYEETKSESIPSNMVLGDQFVELSGFNLPAIYLVNNSVIEKKVIISQLTSDLLNDWLNNK